MNQLVKVFGVDRPSQIEAEGGGTVNLAVHDAHYLAMAKRWRRLLATAHPDAGGTATAFRRTMERRRVWLGRERRWYAAYHLVPPSTLLAREQLPSAHAPWSAKVDVAREILVMEAAETCQTPMEMGRYLGCSRSWAIQLCRRYGLAMGAAGHWRAERRVRLIRCFRQCYCEGQSPTDWYRAVARQSNRSLLTIYQQVIRYAITPEEVGGALARRRPRRLQAA